MGVQINGDTGNVIATKGTFSGDVGIGGTLTYEDVTNVDSVGLITARNGIVVGSGVTLSKDGDIFATGVTTATNFNVDNSSGSGLAFLNDEAKIQTGSSGNMLGIQGGSTNMGGRIEFRGGNDTGDIRMFAQGATSTQVERLRIEKAGNVNITQNINVSGIATVGSAVTISESGIEATGVGITVANINGGQIGGRRNKIYNGAMLVDQRNAGSSTNIEGNTTKYHLDRFSIQGNALDELSAGVARDTDAPDGFAYSLKVTVNTPESSIAADEFVSLYQKMEGQDFQDLAYNKSSPKDITMSFYVKSSITGTFGFTVYRDEPGTDRIVNKFYTINSANTWERKVITIAGDTGKGIQNTNGAVWWNCWHLAAGSDYTSSVSGVWQNYVTTNWAGQESGSAPTNNVITTNGATWAITGVQLETGSQATEFEHSTYQEEIQRCYRYYYKLQPAQGAYFGSGFWYNSNSFICHIDFPVVMRTNATALEQSGTASHYKVIANATTYTCSSAPSFLGDPNNTSQSVNFAFSGSGTQGQGGLGRSGNSNAYLAWDTEL